MISPCDSSSILSTKCSTESATPGKCSRSHCPSNWDGIAA